MVKLWSAKTTIILRRQKQMFAIWPGPLLARGISQSINLCEALQSHISLISMYFLKIPFVILLTNEPVLN